MPKLARFALMVSLLSSLTFLGCDFKPRKKGIPAERQGIENEAQTETVRQMQTVGKALVEWSVRAESETRSSTAPCGKTSWGEGGGLDRVFDLGAMPTISWEELNQLLVPRFLKELPRNDGWGRPYEFRVNTANLACTDVMAFRSPGAEGSFSSHRYLQVGFDPIEEDQDLVWASGYFVRWPSPEIAKQREMREKEEKKREEEEEG